MNGTILACLMGTGGFAIHIALNLVTVVKHMIAGNWEEFKNGPTKDMQKKDVKALLIALASCLGFIFDSIPQDTWDWFNSKFGISKQSIVNSTSSGSNSTSEVGSTSNTQTGSTNPSQEKSSSLMLIALGYLFFYT